MPIYQYRCRKCGNETERIEKFSAPVLQECGCECGGDIERFYDFSMSFNLFNSLSLDQKKDLMKKRSKEHFQKEIRERKNEMDKKSLGD